MSGDRMRVPPPSNIEPPDHPLRVAQQALASLMAQAGFALPDPVEQWKAPDEEAASILGAMLDAGIVLIPDVAGPPTIDVERLVPALILGLQTDGWNIDGDGIDGDDRTHVESVRSLADTVAAEYTFPSRSGLLP